jgi:thioredoxin reductase (NADPH)
MSGLDAIIIGAGRAGLTAATYLARFRRRVLVLSDGPSRASWILESHNTPGFPSGVGGPELMERLQRQATEFGAEIRRARVDGLSRVHDGFEVSAGNFAVMAPAVLLATGVIDRMPLIEGLEAAVRRSLVRMCPICDGYEAIDRRIAVLGDGAVAEREAGFLRTYSDDITVIGRHEGHIGFTDRGPRVGGARRLGA